MKIVNPRFRVLTYFCFALLSVIVQRVVHYFLIAGGYKKAADFLMFYYGFGFAAFLGIVIFVADCYITRENKSLGKFFARVFLGFVLLFIGLCFFPYDIVNEWMEVKILHPFFSWMVENGFFDSMENFDLDYWQGTFYWHFFMTEVDFFDGMVLYGTFQVCTLIKYFCSVKASILHKG